MIFPKLVAVAALAILAVAACGGSSNAPAGASTPPATPGGGTTTSPVSNGGPVDTCALLSPADLKTVTGGDYAPGVVDSVGQCNWKDQGTGDRTVVLYVQDATLDFIKTTFPGGADVTVSGHAGYWNPAEGLRSLWVDVGGRTLVLSFPMASSLGAEDQANAQKLAEIAISKM
jgi:hypothetical protein